MHHLPLLFCVPLRNAEALGSWRLKARLKGSGTKGTTASTRHKNTQKKLYIKKKIK